MNKEVESLSIQLKEYLENMLLIAKKMRAIVLYIEEIIVDEDQIGLDQQIIARDIEIEKYDEIKIEYDKLVKEIEIKLSKTEYEILNKYKLRVYKDQIKDIFELIFEKDRENINKIEKLIQLSKNKISKIQISKKATNSYYAMGSNFSGGKFDNRR